MPWLAFHVCSKAGGGMSFKPGLLPLRTEVPCLWKPTSALSVQARRMCHSSCTCGGGPYGTGAGRREALAAPGFGPMPWALEISMRSVGFAPLLTTPSFPSLQVEVWGDPPDQFAISFRPPNRALMDGVSPLVSIGPGAPRVGGSGLDGSGSYSQSASCAA